MGFAVTSYSDGAVGILSARIVSLDQTLNLPEKGTQVEVDESRYEMFRGPSEKMDKNILSKFVDPINVLKQDIVNVGTANLFFESADVNVFNTEADANNALVANYGSHSANDGVFSERETLAYLTFTGNGLSGAAAHPPAVSVSAGTAVTMAPGGNVNGIVAFNFSATPGVTTHLVIERVREGVFAAGIANTIFFGPVNVGVAFTQPNIAQFIGVGSVYNDIDVFTYFPNLEPPDPSQELIFANQVNLIVDTSNAGDGFANTFFPNGLSTETAAPTPTLGEFVNVSGNIPLIGRVFSFDATTAAGSVAQNTINTKRSEIEEIRVGIESFNGAAIVTKQQKKAHAINTWSGKRMRVVATNDKVNFEAAIQVLTDPNFQS